jgi:hypothetical protein
MLVHPGGIVALLALRGVYLLVMCISETIEVGRDSLSPGRSPNGRDTILVATRPLSRESGLRSTNSADARSVFKSTGLSAEGSGGNSGL